MTFYQYKRSTVSASNVSLCTIFVFFNISTIFVIRPILHNYCTYWFVGQLYVDTYLCIGQYICYALDVLYIIHLYLILLQIFNKCQTHFFDIFLSNFHFLPTFPRLRLKPTGKLAS
jgi:hypothetical protein